MLLRKTIAPPGAAVLAALALLWFAHQAPAALGEDPEKCRDRYGEEIGKRGDSIDAQSEQRTYRGADGFTTWVVFDGHSRAVEVIYNFPRGKFTQAKANEYLALNGQSWVKQVPKLGTAMERDNATAWLNPEGKRAELRVHGDRAASLVVYTHERYAERVARGIVK